MEKHEPCPDCGDDPNDDTLHRGDCRRVLMKGHPFEYLQFGPPWKPWPDNYDEVTERWISDGD